MAGYMWFWAVSGGWPSLATDWDITKVIKNAAIWGLLGWGWWKVKGFLNSPEVTTRLWTFLHKLSPSDAKVVKNFIQTWKMFQFTAWFSERLKNVINETWKSIVPKNNLVVSWSLGKVKSNLLNQLDELENFRVITKKWTWSKFKTLENIKDKTFINKKYLNNIRDLFYWKTTQVEVGKVTLENWKKAIINFENWYLNEIIKKHWKFNLKNFLITVNNPTHKVKMKWNNYNFIKEINWWKDYFVVWVTEFKQWVYMVHHTQRIKTTDIPLKNLLNKWVIIYWWNIW